MKRFTIGVDFGTLSCRALVLDAHTGEALGMGECGYHVYDQSLPCGAKLPERAALADPAEYLQALTAAVREALSHSGVDAQEVAGIAIDATSMSVIPCDENGQPMCFQDKWKNEPQAYIRLWKSYTATREAEEIGAAARAENQPFLTACGGHPSSEGIYPKMLETLRACPELYEATSAYLDLNEFLTWQLTGALTRSTGSLGLKNYCPDGNTLPDAQFFARLHPALASTPDKLRGKALPWGACAGTLTSAWAERLGLPAGIAVGAGAIDGPISMVALGLHHSGDAMLTIGTSGVLSVVSDEWHPVSGICGQARDSLIPGLYGYDFCQSGVGDMFGWFVSNCVPARYEKEAAAQGVSVHTLLSRLGFAQPVRENDIVALDWWNGSRCVIVDQTLTGALSGLTLASTPEQIYRALIEAAAFGTRTLLEHGEACGVKVNRICVCGGIAGKNPLLVQCYADILGRELAVSTLPNSAAAGAAITAAAAAGLYPSLQDAMAQLSQKQFIHYQPNMENHARYAPLYARYQQMRAFYAQKL